MLDRTDVRFLAGVSADHIPGIAFLSMGAEAVLRTPSVLDIEMFGPASVVIISSAEHDLELIASTLNGQLTASIHAELDDDIDPLVKILEPRVGRILFNEWPTGVSVTYAQQHGGPYPASTASNSTSVGTSSIRRFLRPVAYQGFPESNLPLALRSTNTLGIPRRVDGVWHRSPSSEPTELA